MVREATNDGRDRRIAILVSMVILPLDAAGNTERAGHICVFRDAQTLCGKLSNARFWRVFASLSGLCLGQSWLGQSPQRCACVLAGMFAPLVAKTLFELPTWVAMTWMIVWALLGYIFAPYGMWKHHRAQIASPGQRDRK